MPESSVSACRAYASYDQAELMSPLTPRTARYEKCERSFWRPPPSTLRRPMYSWNVSDPDSSLAVHHVSTMDWPSIGLSQRMVIVGSKKMPEGAICATERSFMYWN